MHLLLEFLTPEMLRDAICASGIISATKIYAGDYYSPSKVRSVVYTGFRDGAPVVLKVWCEPRGSQEPRYLERFLRVVGTSHPVFMAPALLGYHIITPHYGWMLMQPINTSLHVYTEPASMQAKLTMLELWRSYRNIFPQMEFTAPTADQVWAIYYARFMNWIRMAREAGHLRDGWYKTCYELVPRALKVIHGMPVVWAHGHFMNSQLFRQPDGRIALTDFAHCRFLPEYHEVALIIWQFFMDNGMQLQWHEVRAHLLEWVDAATKAGVPLPTLRALLYDRFIGAVCADIGARNHPPEVREHLLAIWNAVLTQVDVL